MKTSAAEVLCEYGPFPKVDHVRGVTFDGKHVWFAAGDKMLAFDPDSGEPVRAIDVPGHAGTAFDGRHLFQIAEDRIQKIDPETGRVLAMIPAPGGGGDFGAGVGRRDTLGGPASGPQNPPDRSRHRGGFADHRVQPHGNGGQLGRRRALARHLGRR